MALIDEEQFIPLGGPLDTETDEKVLQVGGVPFLKNAIPIKRGEYGKRPGSDVLPTSLTPGTGNLGSAWQLASYRGALINLQRAPTTDPIGAYSPNAQQWSRVGTTGTQALASGLRGPVSVSRTPLAGDAATNIPGDVAASGGYVFVTHTDANSVTRFYVLDGDTNQVVYRWKVTGIGGISQPRILVVNGYVSLLYFDGGGSRIMASVWQISALDSGSGAPTIYGVSAADAVGIFDAVVATATTLAVAYRQSANQTWRVDFTPSTGATSSVQIRTTAPASINPSLAIAWLSDFAGSGKLGVITAGPAGLQVQWNLTGGTPVSTYVLDVGATVNVSHVTGHTTSNNATGEFMVLYDIASTTDYQLKVGQRTVAGGIAAGLWLRSVGISSRTFTSAGSYYVLVDYRYTGTTQASYFLMQVPTDALANPNPAPQARVAVWQAVTTFSAASNLPSVVAAAVGYVVPVSTVRPELATLATAIELVTIQFNPVLGTPKEAIDGLIVPGGVAGLFDGLNYVGYGFDLFPEVAALTQGTGGALTLTATYWFQTVYARVDANGRVHRSAPSVPVAILLTGSNNRVTVAAVCNRFTDQKIKIEIYRTLANETEPFQYTGSIDNDPNNVTVSFVDTHADTVVAAGAFIYTTGDVPENELPPGFSSVAVFDNRIWGVSMDNPQELWFSQEIEPGIAPGFNEANIVTVADEHGPITAIAAFEGKLAVFKRDLIFGIATAASGGPVYTAQVVATGPGTTNPQSVAVCKEGVFFESTQDKSRISLLNLGFSVDYIGRPVQAYTSPITAAVFLAAKGQVRLYTASMIVLVYDLVYRVWLVWDYAADPDAGFTCATEHGGTAAFVPGGSTVWVDSAAYQDSGGDYEVAMESPPLSMNGLEGFERLRKLLGVGESVSDHTLNVTLYRDFDNTTPAGTFAGAIVAASQPRWDWELRPKIDQMSSCKVRVAFTCPGAGAKVTGFTVIYARKPGGRRGAGSKILKAT